METKRQKKSHNLPICDRVSTNQILNITGISSQSNGFLESVTAAVNFNYGRINRHDAVLKVMKVFHGLQA